jgi:cyclopropane fatty-acyl-phospholipid synthase-like methyltransferase
MVMGGSRTLKTRFLLAVVLVLPLASCAGLDKIDYWKALTSGRDGWQHPERVVASLRIASGDVVADIGSGDGYFVAWLSEAVGPEGRVFAVEVDGELIRELEERVKKERIRNVEVVRGAFEDPRLPDGGVDLIFTCNTYHHIDDRRGYFARLRKDLSPQGRVAHLDERDDLTGILRLFQSEGHWIDVEEMRHEMQQAGYHHVESFDFLPTQSFQVFAPSDAEF